MKQHKPRKRFGQHFLTDQSVIEKIILAVMPKKPDHIVEVGPGLGALTQHLIEQVSELDVIEIDRDVIPKLQQLCQNLGLLHVHQADALTFDFTLLQKEPLRLVGNLPYNISTPLLFHLFDYCSIIKDMHFMLQKEVVERMTAQIGIKDYGRLSIMTQYYCQAELLFDVPPEAFSPPPKVNSSVIRLVPYKSLPYRANDMARFSNIVRLAFNQRRKTIRNCLKNLFNDEQLNEAGIEPNIRAEKISVEQFVRLANLG